MTGEIDGLPYVQFVGTGMVATAVIFSSALPAMFGTFVKHRFQNTYDAILAAPVDVEELVTAEMLWIGLRSGFYGCFPLVVTMFFGLPPSWGMLLVPIFCIITALIFAAFGIAVAATVAKIDQFSYVTTLFVTPLFLVAGTFFPIDQLPEVFQVLAQFNPLHQLVVLVRHASFGFEPTDLIRLGALIVDGAGDVEDRRQPHGEAADRLTASSRTCPRTPPWWRGTRPAGSSGPSPPPRCRPLAFCTACLNVSEGSMLRMIAMPLGSGPQGTHAKRQSRTALGGREALVDITTWNLRPLLVGLMSSSVTQPRVIVPRSPVHIDQNRSCLFLGIRTWPSRVLGVVGIFAVIRATCPNSWERLADTYLLSAFSPRPAGSRTVIALTASSSSCGVTSFSVRPCPKPIGAFTKRCQTGSRSASRPMPGSG